MADRQVVPRPARRRRRHDADRPARDESPRSALWGPRARDILASLTSDDVSDDGFGFLTCREIEVDGTPVLASRISYVGELGWELYVPMDSAADLWDTLLEAGAPARRGAGRHRRVRHHRPDREGLPGVRLRARRRAQHRRGRDAAAEGEGGRLRRQGGLPPAARAVPGDRALHADRRRPHLRQRREALHAGRRADPDPRRRAADRRARPPPLRHHRRARRRRSASTCCWPTCRRTRRRVGNQLAVSYMEELYPVTVGSVDATGLFDPRNERIR